MDFPPGSPAHRRTVTPRVVEVASDVICSSGLLRRRAAALAGQPAVRTVPPRRASGGAQQHRGARPALWAYQLMLSSGTLYSLFQLLKHMKMRLHMYRASICSFTEHRWAYEERSVLMQAHFTLRCPVLIRLFPRWIFWRFRLFRTSNHGSFSHNRLCRFILCATIPVLYALRFAHFIL